MKGLWLWLVIVWLAIGCGQSERPIYFEEVNEPTPAYPHPDSVAHLTGEQLAYRYCQNCHLFPEPDLLPKTIWVERVLPQMGHRLGIRANPREPYRGLSMYDDYLVRQAGIFPDEPKIAKDSWQKLVEYYEQRAPNSFPGATPWRVDTVLAKLQTHSIRLSSHTTPTTTLTHIDTVTGHLWLGNARGSLYKISHHNTLVESGSDEEISPHPFSKESLREINSIQLDSPPSDIHVHPDGTYQVLTMGIMNPADQAKGKLWQVNSNNDLVQLIPTDLQRPVHFAPVNFNGGKVSGWLVAEFGNYLGQLAYYETIKREQIRKQILIDSPGSRKIEVADINQDGLPDVTVLVAQGDERIITWYNQGNGRFQPRQLLRFPPVYGSSYFELADFNQDGRLDILYTNGDNADYSPVIKPYHGIRIFLQTAKGKLQESYFLPMPGASKAMARDFDQDGDLDIAAISFFPDFERTPERGFLYLENQSSAVTLDFSVKTFSMATFGHWLTMDTGDADQDGDIDIVLGSFALPPSQAPDSLRAYWAEKGPHYIVLENQIK